MAAKLFVKTGDTVKVISGEDKGKTGKIQKVFPDAGRVVVEKVNMVKKHQKPARTGHARRDHRAGGADRRVERDARLPEVRQRPRAWATSISRAKPRPPVARFACARNAARPSTSDVKEEPRCG